MLKDYGAANMTGMEVSLKETSDRCNVQPEYLHPGSPSILRVLVIVRQRSKTFHLNGLNHAVA